MRRIRAALAAALLLAVPALPGAPRAQPAAQAEAARALRSAEGELRDAVTRMDNGSLPPSLAMSRLRQALNEVERAMLRMPADSRQGDAWQGAVKAVSDAMALLRQEGTDPRAIRAAAGEALDTLPALRGAETGAEPR